MSQGQGRDQPEQGQGWGRSNLEFDGRSGPRVGASSGLELG